MIASSVFAWAAGAGRAAQVPVTGRRAPRALQLMASGPVTVRQLADALGVSLSAAHITAQNLVDRGLAVRTRKRPGPGEAQYYALAEART